jgi:hypothetical protein
MRDKCADSRNIETKTEMGKSPLNRYWLEYRESAGVVLKRNIFFTGIEPL